MISTLLLAASMSFTAIATGLEKGALVEFIFAGANSDRDYESLFLLDEPIDHFCARLEKAGLPRGKPEDVAACRLWPVGCELAFDPPLETYLSVKPVEGLAYGKPIYTGGTRKGDGRPAAADTMPASLFSIYSLAQSPIVFNGIYHQGVVYGSCTAKDTLKKGTRVTFSVSWETNTLPQTLELVAHPGESVRLLNEIRSAAEKGSVDLLVSFDEKMIVREARAVAKALETLDSPRVKINGRKNIFYRSFLPLVKWQDRKERLVQPFELTLGETNRLVRIDEDWSGEGADPRLTPVEISFAEIVRHPKIDTCFVFCREDTTIETILSAMKKFPERQIKNWYIFER